MNRSAMPEHPEHDPPFGADRPRGDWPDTEPAMDRSLGRLVRSALAAHPELATATDPLDAPSDTELDAALRTVVRHLKARRQDEWERAVEGLADSVTLDPDQLYQAQRYAALKGWVLEHVPLAEPSAFAALIPERVGRDTNTARTIERLRADGQLLAVPYKRGWRYPLAQIDRRGRVHAPIPALLARATEQGYDPWEIVHFLARPTVAYPPLVVGTAVADGRAFESLDALVDAAVEHAPEQSPPTPGPSPFERLAAGDEAGFARAVRHFLGEEDPMASRATR